MRSRFLATIDRDKVPTEAAARWDFPDSTLEHVQDSESFVYRISSTDGARYLRLTHVGHRSIDMIQAELEFVEHLAACGVPVSRPIPSKAGQLIETIASGAHEFHASVFEAAAGDQLRWRTESWNADNFRLWGAALARIHAASKTFKSPRFKRFDWSEDDVWANAERYLPESDSLARTEFHRIQEWLSERPQNPDDFGMVHGDLCAANFHVSGSTVTAFDFDDCCYHWFIYDIVCTVAPATFRPEEERRALRSAILEGYVGVERLPANWQSSFDMLLRMRGMFLYVLNHRNWEADMSLHPKRALLDALRGSFDHPVKW